jgi:hypothetical protein
MLRPMTAGLHDGRRDEGSDWVIVRSRLTEITSLRLRRLWGKGET